MKLKLAVGQVLLYLLPFFSINSHRNPTFKICKTGQSIKPRKLSFSPVIHIRIQQNESCNVTHHAKHVSHFSNESEFILRVEKSEYHPKECCKVFVIKINFPIFQFYNLNFFMMNQRNFFFFIFSNRNSNKNRLKKPRKNAEIIFFYCLFWYQRLNLSFSSGFFNVFSISISSCRNLIVSFFSCFLVLLFGWWWQKLSWGEITICTRKIYDDEFFWAEK